MCCVCGDVMKRGKTVKRVGIKLPVGRRLQALEKVITDTSTLEFWSWMILKTSQGRIG